VDRHSYAPAGVLDYAAGLHPASLNGLVGGHRFASIASVRRISEHQSMPIDIDIVRALSSLPLAHDLPAPPDMVAFRLRDITNSGMDITAVEKWVAENGGNTAVQPVPILSGVATWRPREESIERYFVVPLACLEQD